ncbi:DUF2461 domain-containing protein [Flavobacterium sp.]|uniref:DUF2461 domain-containing protein n=1 Tax=Flavobacterium sp. TaxID=239 RepID=UPI0026046CF7|nr:DUF2461 domain-containing protein [Flavobacterium sp.]MDG2431694.1 DUF2461 domain-containing protein [Flavobacterium sp.]
MSTPIIKPSTITFLSDLAQNNNRDWFAKNKSRYTSAHENMIAFVEELLHIMSKHDALATPSGKKSLYRIYNDVRFSANKAPYKPRFAFGIQRASAQRRGGYYVHLQPGNNFLACGFFSPNPADLKRIRQDIEQNPATWRQILGSKKIKQSFGTLTGNQVPTFPKGFPKEHEAIDLIKYKQFIVKHHFTDQEILQPNFLHTIDLLFQDVRPFFDYLSIVLTTDANGVSLI